MSRSIPRPRARLPLTALFVIALSVPLGSAVAADAHPADTARSAAQPAHQHPAAHADAHPAAVYVCPMHPDVVRDAPGRCPICGMYLEKKGGSGSR